MRLAVVVVLGAAACANDPTLRVDVEHPTAVSRTTITVYEPQSFACEDVEFGDVSEGTLAAALVAELEKVGKVETGDLDDLSRTAPKVIVARGFDDQGALVTAGCEDKGEIKGRDHVTIFTVRTAVASIGPLLLGGMNPFSLEVALTDPVGGALPGRDVSWRVLGPSGSEPAESPNAVTEERSGVWRLKTPTCVDSKGGTILHPVPPSTIGGFAVQVRPSWAIEPPPLVTGFTRIPSSVEPIATPGMRHPCALRSVDPPGAQLPVPSLVCLELTNATPAALVAREYATVTSGGMSKLQIRDVDPTIPQDLVALYSVARGDSVRDVYGVTRGGRVANIFTPSVLAAPLATQVGLRTGIAFDALVVPRCSQEGFPPRVFMRIDTATERKVVVMDELGSVDSDFHGIRSELNEALGMRAAGCVTELESTNGNSSQQAVIVDGPPHAGMMARLTTTAYFDCVVGREDQCFVDLPLTRAGAGFYPGSTPLLAGANLDATGIVVSRWALLFGIGGYQRVEFPGRVPAAAAPLHMVYGNFDDDDELDAFWNVGNIDQTETSFQFTYSQPTGLPALSTLSPSQPLLVGDILVGDVTGDGIHDVVVVGTSSDTTPAVSGALIIPSRVPAALPALKGIDTCPVAP